MRKYSYMCLAILFVFSFLVSCIPTSISNEPKTWQKTYGRTGLDGAQCIKQTKDGGYIAVGWTYSYEQGLADVYVVKLDANGELTWGKTYGGDDWGKGKFDRMYNRWQICHCRKIRLVWYRL